MLKRRPILEGAKVIAEMGDASGLDSGEDYFVTVVGSGERGLRGVLTTEEKCEGSIWMGNEK